MKSLKTSVGRKALRPDVSAMSNRASVQESRPSTPAALGARRWVKGRSVAAKAVAVLMLVLGPVTARAQWTVYDPANYAENALQYAHQLLQIKYQLQQVQYQLQALAKLGRAPWRDVNAPLAGIAAAMGGSGTLGYAAPNAPTTFQTLFPVSRPVQDWPTEQLTRAQIAVDVLRSALTSTAAQQSAVPAGTQAIERMKELNGSVQGHEQALELQNTAAVYSAEELMLLRQAAMAQTNIQAVYYANQMNAEAQRDVTVRATLAQLAVPPAPSPDISLRVTP
jgi:P-type conjugative transfer protein TrbJ